MARLTQAPMTPRRAASGPDSLTDLNRLLARLQQNILQASAEQERRLRTSEYERSKAGINLEYARTLLTKLEHEALAVKVHTRRAELQADLNRKRDLFGQLTERLRELDDLSLDSDADSSDGEDLLGDTIQTPSESLDSRSPDRRTRDSGEEPDAADADAASAPAPTQPPSPSFPATATATSAPPAADAAPTPPPPSRPPGAPDDAGGPGLRARGPAARPAAAAPKEDTAETTGRQRLFGDRADTADATTTGLAATATTEAILDNQRAEQEKLSASLLGMASALKASSRSFALSLEEEKDILQAAGAGLDRNERGLEAAARRMGTLRRMSEGKGWFGRMMLYAWIFGLMVVAVLLVFVLPKLRF